MSKVSQVQHDAASPGPRKPADLRQDVLRRAVLTGGLWSSLEVVAETGSTNEDLLAAARAGAAEGAVLAAERQTRGRGRQGRSWLSTPGSALTFSVLLRPAAVPPASRGWLPLLAGVAIARAIREVSGVDVTLKWPNDVLAGGAKLAGILAEQAGDAIVVGAGINVGASRDELPAPPTSSSLPATSLALRGAAGADREALLTAMLRELETWYLRWAARTPPEASGAAEAPGDAEGCGLRAEYLRWCSTVGRDLRVELPGGSALAGFGAGIDHVGRLVVDTPIGAAPVSAGDVIHVR